ncbi:MAG: phosphate acyltransferase PlsX [Planctomycetota bacterium]|nr:phosphate acyltransferase PlsX [Planctomycetota bacterium]
MRLPIAVDAMGGDRAPAAVVRGALKAVEEMEGLRIELVGSEPEILRELEAAAWEGDSITVVPASETVGMGESPVEAVRTKKDSSVSVGLKRVRDGQACALVSAGNTGASVAAASLLLRTLPEVRKAGIAVVLNVGVKPLILMDVGANVEARPKHLVQYGVMASLYASRIHSVQDPSVGLLNIGEENAKGNRLTKQTHDLFRASDVSFHGNVEPGELFGGVCDVAVCDGFTGNIVLKLAEGLAERLFLMFKDGTSQVVSELVDAGDVGSGKPDTAVSDLVQAALARLGDTIDYAESGGAPLLGVNGTVIISHGRSGPKAISNAIRMANKMAEVDINSEIVQNLRTLSSEPEPGEEAGAADCSAD